MHDAIRHLQLISPGHTEVPEALRRALAVTGLSADKPPSDPDTWQVFLGKLAHEITDLTGVGGLSFQDLFDKSPAPTVLQDYSEVLEWMAELREQGVTNLREYLAADRHRLVAGVSRIHITAINPAGVAVVGKPYHEVIGPVDPAIMNEGSEPSWTLQLETVWNGERMASIDFDGASADGTPFDARLTMVVHEVNGLPDYTRVIVTIHDVTEHRARERQMQRLVEDKTQFLASVSHEVRTPLTAVVGYAQILHDDDGTLSPEDRQAMTEVLSRQAQDVAHLIDDLLVAARAELGQLPMTHEEINVDKEVQSVVDGLDFSGKELILPEPIDPPCRCTGDPGRFRQIVRNLLTNANRYGGDRIAIEIEEIPSDVLVRVSDSGPGLSPEDAIRVFKPYERAQASRPASESVGIGLTISRQLAELMGGDLCYVRDTDWTTFQLRVPKVTSVREASG